MPGGVSGSTYILFSIPEVDHFRKLPIRLHNHGSGAQSHLSNRLLMKSLVTYSPRPTRLFQILAVFAQNQANNHNNNNNNNAVNFTRKIANYSKSKYVIVISNCSSNYQFEKIICVLLLVALC